MAYKPADEKILEEHLLTALPTLGAYLASKITSTRSWEATHTARLLERVSLVANQQLAHLGSKHCFTPLSTHQIGAAVQDSLVRKTADKRALLLLGDTSETDKYFVAERGSLLRLPFAVVGENGESLSKRSIEEVLLSEKLSTTLLNMQLKLERLNRLYNLLDTYKASAKNWGALLDSPTNVPPTPQIRDLIRFIESLGPHDKRFEGSLAFLEEKLKSLQQASAPLQAIAVDRLEELRPPSSFNAFASQASSLLRLVTG
ncbi:MAG: hypothetical protein JSR76_07025 [Verrucomicrobia bacterium]|nr:hypothetical protein [Verrucomicrobiota bacterium]